MTASFGLYVELAYIESIDKIDTRRNHLDEEFIGLGTWYGDLGYMELVKCVVKLVNNDCFHFGDIPRDVNGLGWERGGIFGRSTAQPRIVFSSSTYGPLGGLLAVH